MAVAAGSRFFKLWQEVESSVSVRNYPSAQLRDTLEQNRAAFANPLRRYERTADARAAVERGRITIGGETHVLTKEFSALALEVAERLQLHELTAVLLLRDAHARQSLRPGADLRDVAAEVFYEERRALLYALATLLKARLDPAVCPAVAAVAAEFTDGLAAGGVARSVLRGAREALSDARRHGRAPHLRALALAELRDACAVAFHVAYQFALDAEDYAAALALLRDAHTEGKSSAEAEEACDTLVLALVAAFDPLALLTDPRLGTRAPNSLLRSDAALATLHPLVAGAWDDAPGRRAALLFAWLQLLDAARAQAATHTPLEAAQVAQLRQDVMDAAWDEFARIAASPRVRNDAENRDVLQSVLERMLVEFVAGIMLTDLPFIFPRHEPQHAIAFMRFITALYDSNDRDAGLKFWGVDASSRGPDESMAQPPDSGEAFEAQCLRQFLGFLVESCTAETMTPLLECLTSLACGEASAMEAYKFLRNSQVRRIQWSFFFESVERYVIDFNNDRRHQMMLHENDTLCLCAICKLIATVARWNEQARLWLFENSSWRALQMLFSLAMCPVDHRLKGALADAIAAFALTPTIATNVVWVYLEQSQILPTLPGRVAAADAGIRFEIDTIEASVGRFPYLSSFLLLLQTLFKSAPIPTSLGSGQRAQGVLPYLAFVRDSVFLRLDALPFVDLSEKWGVAQRCLSIFFELLRRAELSEADFSRQGSSASLPREKSPAFVLLNDFLGHGRVLRALMDIVVTASSEFQKEHSTGHLGQSALLSMKIIDTVFALAEDFSLKESEFGIARIEAQTLRAALTRDPSFILATGRLVGCAEVPGVALYAARIIRTLSSQTDVVARVLSEPSVHLDMIAAFVLCLQCETSDSGAFDAQTSPAAAAAAATEDAPPETARRVVMRILIENLSRPTPNLTQGLLTYRPGIPLDFVSTRIRTPLHEVVALLEPGRMLMKRDPLLCESCHEFVYRLLTDRDLWRPVSALLHAEPEEFVLNGIVAFPIDTPDEDQSWELASHLMSLSWFMRTVAADIRLSAVSKNRSHLIRIMERLFLLQSSQQQQQQQQQQQDFGIDGGGNRALAFFSALNVPVKDPLPVAPTLFRGVDVRACMYQSKRGVTETSVLQLHERLQNARMQIVEANASFAAQAETEIRQILASVVRHNAFQNVQGALFRAYEGWKQVIEVTLFSAFSHLNSQMRENVLFELLEAVVARAAAPMTAPSVSGVLSVVALSLVSKLRACRPVFDFARRTGGLPSARIVDVVRGLSACALKQGGDVLLRGNIFAALYHFLRFCSRAPTPVEAASIDESCADVDLAMIEDARREHDALEEGLADMLAERGWDKLFEHAWRDALEAPAIWRAVVAAALQELHRIDARRDSHWLRSIAAGKGYLKGLVDAVSAELRLAHDSPDALCVHEARLALLTSIAKTDYTGATLLFQADAVGALSRSTTLASQALAPMNGSGEAAAAEDDDFFYDDFGDDHQSSEVQVLLPVLRFVATMLVGLGDNVPLAAQAVDLLRQCSDAVVAILRERPRDAARLHAMEAIATIFHALAPNERLFAERLPSAGANMRRLLLSIFARCTTQMDDESAMVLCSACNEVLAYCIALLTGGRQTLFAATAADDPQHPQQAGIGPNLMHLVAFLAWALLQQRTLQKRLQTLAATTTTISQVSGQRLEALAQVPGVDKVLVEELDLPVRQQLAKARVAEEAAAARKALSVFRCAVESGLLVLLKHAEALFRSPLQGRILLSENTNALRRSLVSALEEPRSELSVSIAVEIDDMDRASAKPGALRTIFRRLLEVLSV